MAAAVEGQERLVEVESVAGVEERRPAGEEKTFRPYDPDQVLLMAPVLSEWLPDGHLAHFVSDLVESGALDLAGVYDAYEEERGYPPYDPRLMLKLIVYGYAIGVVSSRKLERASYEDVAVRMLCADQHPDHRSIARFRKRHLAALGELFVQTLRLCRQAELVGLGALALDGTKLRANASRHKAMSYERMVKTEAQLEAELAALRANVAGAAGGGRSGRCGRGRALRAGSARRRAARRSCSAASSGWRRSGRRSRRSRRRRARPRPHAGPSWSRMASKPRRPPNGRDPFKPKPKAQRNFTDPDSKIMKTADGAFHQCYNGQALVDSKAQVIVAAELSDEAPDARQLAPALDQLVDNLAAVDAELPDARHAERRCRLLLRGQHHGSPASTGSTRTSRPGGSNTPSRRRPRRAGRSRRTRRRNSGWRAS